jgi:hypothetical protein
MLMSFCAASNLRGFLHRSDCPPVLKSCATILENCVGKERGVAIMTEIRALGPDTDEERQHSDIPWGKEEELSSPIREAIKSIDTNLPTSAFFHQRCTIRGTAFTTCTASKRDSRIFFQLPNSDEPVPGVISDIISIPVKLAEKADHYKVLYYFVIRRHLPLSEEQHVADPFREYPDFGAQLWSDKLADEPEVVQANELICHSVGRPWATGVVVLKALNRVSFFIFRKRCISCPTEHLTCSIYLLILLFCILPLIYTSYSLLQILPRKRFSYETKEESQSPPQHISQPPFCEIGLGNRDNVSLFADFNPCFVFIKFDDHPRYFFRVWMIDNMIAVATLGSCRMNSLLGIGHRLLFFSII